MSERKERISLVKQHLGMPRKDWADDFIFSDKTYLVLSKLSANDLESLRKDLDKFYDCAYEQGRCG